MFICIYLVFLINIALTLCQNHDVTEEIATNATAINSNTTKISQNYAFLHNGNAEDPGQLLLQEEIVLPSDAGIEISHTTNQLKPLHFIHKKLPLQSIQAFIDTNIAKPISEKFSKINDFIALTNHPNYGGIQLLSPQNLWEKLNQKGQHFLTSAHGAVFGFGQTGNHDYPFPYRKLNRSKRNYLKDKLDNYTENYKNHFSYDFNLIKLNDSETYKFPFILGEKNIKEFVKNVTNIIEN